MNPALIKVAACVMYFTAMCSVRYQLYCWKVFSCQAVQLRISLCRIIIVLFGIYTFSPEILGGRFFPF